MSRRNYSSAVLVIAILGGCGGDGKETPKPSNASAKPSGTGACALLMQGEVDEIFGEPVGSGANESLEGGTELCTWPAGEDPALLLQIGPAVPSATAAVDLGEGYRVAEISGMSGPAAIAFELPSGEEAGKAETVALLAMNAAGKTVTLSPVGLGIEESSGRFEKLKALVESVSQRL